MCVFYSSDARMSVYAYYNVKYIRIESKKNNKLTEALSIYIELEGVIVNNNGFRN
jgi:hypothetical protein